MGKACEECTQHCLMMHKKERNPASIVTTFCKVMIGDDYSKTMLLPPNFACRVKNLVGETTQLEDYNGQKWVVNFTMIDERLAFEGGWNTFALAHGLQKGDILVFHYIMKSHFVVLMYGSTGLPETRHYGSYHQLMKKSKISNKKLTVNGQSSLKVNAICNNTSHESSSKTEPVVHEVNSVNTVNKKGKEAMMSPKEKEMNASVPDYMQSKSPTCLVDNTNNNSLQPVAVEMESGGGQKNNVAASRGNLEYEINRVKKSVASDGSLKNNVAASGGGGGSDKSVMNRIQKPILESNGGQKNNVAVSGGGTDETEINRIRKSVESGSGRKNTAAASDGGGSDESIINRIQKPVLESNGGQKNNVAVSGGGADETEINRVRKTVESGSGRKNTVAGGVGADETDINQFRKSLEKRIDNTGKKRKESTVVQSEIAQNNSMHKRMKLNNDPMTLGQPVKIEPFSGVSPKPMDKWMERVKREPIMNRDSGGLIKKEPTMDHCSEGLITRTPKPEPEDYDETLLSGTFNTPISAIMSSYQYLELPSSVKWKGNKVILLRNGADRWPVLYQFHVGIKALTQNWSIFAKEKGIKPGDKCDFVLVSEPTNRFACNVYDVHVTRQ